MLNLSLLILLFGATCAKEGSDSGSGNGRPSGKGPPSDKGEKVKKGTPPEGEGGPLSSCSRQAGCLEFEVWDESTVDASGDKQYSICLFWDETNFLCYKDGAISHACPVQGDNLDAFKVEGWESGSDNKLPCVTATCGETVTFGVKDGPECDPDPFSPIGAYDITCSAGGSCGGNAKACQWVVKAPDCDDSSTTTTSPTVPPTTTSTATTSTSTATASTGAPTTTTTAATTTTTTSKCFDESLECSDYSRSGDDCEAVGCCQWQWVNSEETEGACVEGSVSVNSNANAVYSVRDVLYTNDLQKAADEGGMKSGGLGYVMVSVEALIVVSAILAAILLITGAVCCIMKRRKVNHRFVVEDEEAFDDDTQMVVTTAPKSG